MLPKVLLSGCFYHSTRSEASTLGLLLACAHKTQVDRGWREGSEVRALAAVAEDPGLFTAIRDPTSRGSHTVFCPLGHYTCVQAYLQVRHG